MFLTGLKKGSKAGGRFYAFKKEFYLQKRIFKVKVKYITSHGLISPETVHRLTRARGAFLGSPETLRAIFGCHNSPYNSRTESI